MTTRHEPLRVGVLFSQSGAFGSTEAEHLRGALLAVADINAGGGVGGRLLQPIVCDPASDPHRLRNLAHELIVHEGVVSLFGCASSSMRKVLLPIVERHNTLLWYPTQFEGFEYSPNVLYGGPCPNQCVLPLAELFCQSGYQRVALLGSDYLFPHECNRVMASLVRQYGGEVCAERYLPLDASLKDHGELLHAWMRDPPDVIFSTLVGASALALFQAYRQGGYAPARTPIATICATESEIAQSRPEWFDGHLCSLPYFESIQTPQNQAFVQRLRARFGPQVRASFMVESAYVQMHLFAQAAELAGRTETEALREAVSQVAFHGPRGPVRVDPLTHYTWYRTRIGRVNAAGGFELVHDGGTETAPDPYLVAQP